MLWQSEKMLWQSKKMPWQPPKQIFHVPDCLFHTPKTPWQRLHRLDNPLRHRPFSLKNGIGGPRTETVPILPAVSIGGFRFILPPKAGRGIG